jgi:deoxyribodipyrimidine photo-lyase
MPDKTYQKSIFIFRRDLRLEDNNGLISALKESEDVVPIFIFTPEQLVNNSYKSDNAVQFMMESLEELNNDLKKKGSRLFYFYGKPDEVVEKLIKKVDADAVFVNMDYTPYSVSRDKSIKRVCDKEDVDFVIVEDVLLNPVGSVKTSTGTIYLKFTPYFREAKKEKVDKPKNNNYKNYISKRTKIVGEFRGNPDKFYENNDDIVVRGGRDNGLKILGSLQKFKSYNSKRDILNWNTTRLSAYIKFGCISIREVYHKFKSKLGARNDLIKQLYWRDFYYNVGFYHPRVFKKKDGNLKEKYNKLKWKNNPSQLKKWKDARTGFPIVDACMREINETGFMHNRGRLIVGSFLVKILLIDWKLGEKYFSNKLVDIDLCVNNGNWGWVSGSGSDAQPYFRIFNPWLQGETYDKNCEYIKKWIPELKDVDAKHIHKWYDYYDEYDVDYPKPMVDYADQKKKVLKAYKAIYK